MDGWIMGVSRFKMLEAGAVDESRIGAVHCGAVVRWC